jgi:SPX domain protein involved in polyphosphate accumulation
MDPHSEFRFLSRYECKYLVDPLLVPGMREFLQPFVQPDRYAGHLGDYRYAICSLYLDTDDLRLYQQTVGGEKNRFKLRVRTYSDNPESPAFLEIKRKVDSTVQKRRVRLTRAEVREVLARGVDRRLYAEDTMSHIRLSAAKPVMKVKYLREAYESSGGDPVRVTFDTDLMFAVTLDHELSHAHGRWTTTPVDGTIFEIKFTERFPAWVSDLVRTFGLKQQSVPKYVMSVDQLLQEGGQSALTLGGFSLPPLQT